jgi:hypothetical protein
MTFDRAPQETRPWLRETFSNWRHWVFFFLTSVVYNVFFLRTFSHWWFEDDPYLFGFVRTIRNPAAFFARETIKSLGAGGALTPFQALSEWIDSHIAYRSLGFAHFHNTVSVAVTLMLLFHVLRRFGVSIRGAIVVCLLWLCLPATIVVTEFLSARHYLEGFAVSLLAVAFTQNLTQGAWREKARTIALLCLTVASAMLFKELYAITVPLFCGIYLFEAKRNRAALASLILIPLYFVYRYWVFGPTVASGSPWLRPAEYLIYLARVPYTLVGNFGGYVLVLLALALLVLFARQHKTPGRFLIYAALVLGSDLAVIYPVAFPVSLQWLDHGTWCRVLFLLGSGLLIAGGIACFHAPMPRRARIFAAVLTFAILIPGAVVTRTEWQRLMLQSKREGTFYVAHPDRLLYSEVPAAFFLDGVRLLYDIPVRHHVFGSERQRPPAETLNRHQTIWRVVDGKYVEDPKLFSELRANAAQP